MPTVTILVSDDGDTATVQIKPPLVTIGGGAPLSLQWNLVPNNTGWTWSTDVAGIVIAATPPSPYLPWNGSTAAPGPGGSYVATGQANFGAQTQRFKYTINLSHGGDTPGRMSIDPDIANEPQGGMYGTSHGTKTAT